MTHAHTPLAIGRHGRARPAWALGLALACGLLAGSLGSVAAQPSTPAAAPAVAPAPQPAPDPPATPAGSPPVAPTAAAVPDPACATLAQASAAGTAPDGRDRGLLFELQRDGRTLHLYGTLHAGRPAWAVAGPKVRAGLTGSDLLAVELDSSDPAVIAEFVRALPQLGEPAPALNQRLLATATRHCGDARALAAAPPLLRMLGVAVLLTRFEGLDPALGSEARLLALARELKRPVVALEQPAMQAQALAPERPSDLEPMLLELLQEMDDGSARQRLRRLVTAWEQGDLADLADYPRWCECLNSERARAWNVRLNDERNRLLASRIEALHSAGQRVFAAVGVLHFTGPEALQTLLERRGFVVRQVPLR